MSRRRNRGRSAAPAQPAAQTMQIPQLSSPVTLDTSGLLIEDLEVLVSLDAAGGNTAALQALQPQLIPFLDRIVVGGIRKRPLSEFWLLVYEVKRQMVAPQGN